MDHNINAEQLRNRETMDHNMTECEPIPVRNIEEAIDVGFAAGWAACASLALEALPKHAKSQTAVRMAIGKYLIGRPTHVRTWFDYCRDLCVSRVVNLVR